MEKISESDEKIAAKVCTNGNKTFSTFENVLTNNELAVLRSIGSSKKDDSSFVLNSIRFLYKNDIDKMSCLSLTGRSRGPEAKQKMSPNKYDTVNKMFLERLTSFELNSTEFTDRSKQIDTHVKNAFINTKRHGKPSDDEKIIRKINEEKDAN